MRSSSYTKWDLCQFAYFLTYCLGFEDVSGISAEKGNIVHKALELLARKKLAIQNGFISTMEPDTGETFNLDQLTPEFCIDWSWNYYTKVRKTIHTWTPKEFRECTRWTHKALDFQNGAFNPLNRDVVAPEQFFDFIIDKPWASFSYDMPDGSKLEGKLGIKGTVDLITKVNNDTLELIDWKTGKATDWATGKQKTFDKLENDPQLLIYFYALARLFPQYKYIIITIFFMNDGGPFTVPFDRARLPEIENILKNRFLTIKNSKEPSFAKYTSLKWKCKFCHYFKNQQPGSSLNICDYMEKQVKKNGFDETFISHVNVDRLKAYVGGGKIIDDTTKMAGKVVQ